LGDKNLLFSEKYREVSLVCQGQRKQFLLEASRSHCDRSRRLSNG